MGQALADDEYPDAYALFVARKLRNPDSLALATDWMNFVEGHGKATDGETAKDEEGGQIEPRE